ncbi:hypothetical protein D3C81_105590 [compost metagenome]|uniref:DUF596 domain-containing protein n=2 Tax=Serratia plymuthica TaxID=82996 RepID=S4YJJ8_SERPL|nr:DUF596 domain-containing protein [Serratia plymuthica]AGP45547.1 hypothetical protein M621_18790 [Serratia plymuthica S13]ANJ96351.1 hypothetical protein ADP72_17520 [Serratia plymuthica]KYG18222.1 hypothetical protein SOD10_04400 [Serratia plymuthica]MBI6139550.1 DUF596 domain-containing protein [Serratia plymuthica]NIC28586.1 DUF596 domain-containing protein [Serratia plymuthica]
MLYSDEEYELFSQELDGSSVGTIWSAMIPENFNGKKISYDEKKGYFLELLQRLMQDGKIKLGKHDRLLDGSIDKQIDMYRKAMPSCEQEMYYGLWFTFEECPGGAVWIYDDGYQDWT